MMVTKFMVEVKGQDKQNKQKQTAMHIALPSVVYFLFS